MAETVLPIIRHSPLVSFMHDHTGCPTSSELPPKTLETRRTKILENDLSSNDRAIIEGSYHRLINDI